MKMTEKLLQLREEKKKLSTEEKALIKRLEEVRERLNQIDKELEKEEDCNQMEVELTDEEEINELNTANIINGKRKRPKEGTYREERVEQGTPKRQKMEKRSEGINDEKKKMETKIKNNEIYKEQDRNIQRKRVKRFQETLSEMRKEENEVEELGNLEEINQEEEITIEGVAGKYKKALRKKEKAIEANKKELRAWYEYAEWFSKKMEIEQAKYEGLGKQTIRRKIYDELEKLLAEESRNRIKKRTQNAEKVYILFKDNLQEMDRSVVTGMSYFEKTKMGEILEMKKQLEGRKDKEEVEESPRVSEIITTDEDIQQEISKITDKEVQELINGIGEEIGNISGTTTPLEEGS